MATPTLTDILELSIAERIQLVEDIWDSIEAVPERIDLTAAQSRELDRRLEAYRKQPESSVPWAEVKQRIRAL